MISFYAIYFPGFLACSIILTQILFKQTSDILFLFITLLAGASIIASSHFLASFFSKAQLAGLYSSTLAFALALITLAATLTSDVVFPQVLALSLIFPPCAWATFIADVALREYRLRAFSLSPAPYTDMYGSKLQRLDGYLYVAFFILQIVLYSAAAYGVERKLWGVTRKYDLIEASDNVALRVTGLSKTYNGKRPWYWPFMRKGAPVLAVDSLNLEVKTGSVTFLLGPNGGGKTTTLKCVAGMTSMDAGSRLELNESGLVFGICPQSNVFWENLTVDEHIKIWKKLKNAAYSDPSEDDGDVLAECDLLDKGPSQAKTLSGGQMRKLQLAIAFVGGSKVCCIDEASSGLDPLSRRNIWNIIQKGHSRRTVLVTTHFLDEADILADHIAIVYKGKLVCEGPGTSLKAKYGDDYIIRSEFDVNGETMVWRSSNSAEATRKILELEALTEDDNTYNVTFPTLEQVFLKVTSDTAVHDHGGDGMVGEEETNNVIDEKIFALENDNAEDIDLDVGHNIGLARQVLALYKKRYTLLLQKAGWISYGINVIIPIIIAAALVKFLHKFKSLQTCEANAIFLRNATAGETSEEAGYLVIPPLDYQSFSSIQSTDNRPSTYLGPASAFTGETQDQLYIEIVGRYGYRSFGVYAPAPETATFFYSTYKGSWQVGTQMIGFSLLTNRISNTTVTNGAAKISTADVRVMRHPANKVDVLSMPIAVLITLAFISAGRYLLFDMQFITVQSLFVWGLLFAQQSLQRLWYAPSYLLGTFLLFGIATYLGTYVISLFTKKAAFAVAAGLHALLFVLYVVSYVMNSSFGDDTVIFDTYNSLQYGLGLSSPGANLVRALFLSSNSFEILCGKYADNDVAHAFSYDRYGSVYANLIIQILFLVAVLVIYEYGSADWVHRNITHRGVPSRLHYIVESGDAAPPLGPAQTEKNTTSPAVTSPQILTVSRVSKYFGKTFAVENVSFDISANQTLALLGGNGAGKTTVINMIRGELKPNFGDIYFDGVSVARQPQKARLHIGVCPQDDAIDNLTVRQTLRFYATVKGLKNVEGNVDRILAALNITMYEGLSVRALSGGTRRKLSVAIALLGNPRVLLLDEPSTGQDAGAKRILWKALQSISANRAILLTTHSMEEAEALATNVAIMGTKMLATGTLTSLQESHGGAYSVRAVRVPELSSDEVESIVKEKFEGMVKGYSDAHGQIGWQLPHDKRALGSIMRVMEELMGDVISDEEEEENVQSGSGSAGGAAAGGSSAAVSVKVIQAYTVTGPTLEEVFMNVAREAGQAGGV
ncbi:putative ABC transporter A family member 4 [Leptodontidium sp. 2 PMI_412]|nr:putative ABC transporter A family member 4 [Leptodontidium sp. 2 PMI_412]